MVAREWGGVVPYFREIYGRALYHSASRALHAFERFDVACKAKDDAEAVSSVHEALGHCGNLSRYFWPSKQNSKRNSPFATLAEARGSKLREAFGVTDESPLKDRALRDSLEHFDERLDRYFLGLDSGTIFPDPIIGAYQVAKIQYGHIFKLVDPKNEIFVVLGFEFNYGSLRPEIQRIADGI
ncbi:hypothetical protein JR064_21580 [Xanthomonas sp. CFBP 8703]|uniref:Uncharacterized protein n=1 Tax=Xanthomonas bonasiae TaxID=2810351 RepID=A0ABS3B9K6_9XANT|nr:hypothetical protein [Xanthomonas bonasiae]MBN6104759.1 hypothetical protein [Xanthomonas bonasiae]